VIVLGWENENENYFHFIPSSVNQFFISIATITVVVVMGCRAR
jgi:hypothetical protein